MAHTTEVATAKLEGLNGPQVLEDSSKLRDVVLIDEQPVIQDQMRGLGKVWGHSELFHACEHVFNRPMMQEFYGETPNVSP
jgi:hypothetical protein